MELKQSTGYVGVTYANATNRTKVELKRIKIPRMRHTDWFYQSYQSGIETSIAVEAIGAEYATNRTKEELKRIHITVKQKTVNYQSYQSGIETIFINPVNSFLKLPIVPKWN